MTRRGRNLPPSGGRGSQSELPHALGCDGWFTARVTTCGELDQALQQAGHNGSASYLEVVTDEYAAPPLPQKMHENRDTLYAR